MNEEIEARIFGLENIIHGTWHNISLLEYISFNLHKSSFNLSNIGIHWIWTSLMGDIILDFYKLAHKKEKHSFQKVLNFCQNEKCKINFGNLQLEIDKFVKEYEDYHFESVRSQYLAHQDLNTPEYFTSIRDLRTLTNKAIKIFEGLTNELGRKNAEFTNIVTESFSEIFERIDEYEEISSLLLANALKGKKTVEISQIQRIIEKREQE